MNVGFNREKLDDIRVTEKRNEKMILTHFEKERNKMKNQVINKRLQ